MSEEPSQQPEILVPTNQLAGVWANWARVTPGEHEFTLDFVRMDSTAPPPGQGVLVSRVSASPILVLHLMESLEAGWHDYARSALPPDIYGDESAQEDV